MRTIPPCKQMQRRRHATTTVISASDPNMEREGSGVGHSTLTITVESSMRTGAHYIRLTGADAGQSINSGSSQRLLTGRRTLDTALR